MPRLTNLERIAADFRQIGSGGHAKSRLLEDEQALHHGIEIRRLGFWLELNEKQYLKLKHLGKGPRLPFIKPTVHPEVGSARSG